MILSIMLLVPIIGSLFVLAIPNKPEFNKNIRRLSCLIILVNIAINIKLLLDFDYLNPAIQFVEHFKNFGLIYGNYSVGLDALGLSLLTLTNFMMLAIPFINHNLEKKQKTSAICYMLLQSAIIGSFIAQDLMLFYICFESTLIPMFFIVMIFGGKNRVYASYKLFFYTFAASLPMLVGILWLYDKNGSVLLSQLLKYKPDEQYQFWLFISFFLACAVKIPIWPLHTWLPYAHVEAPTGGSVVLAALLLKLGTYALVKFAIPCFPQGFADCQTVIHVLCVISIIYGGAAALVQKDLKKMIAYSSVSHMGFCVIGCTILSQEALIGAFITMISHGIVSAGMFAAVGIVYERAHTRELGAVQGLAHLMPNYSALTFILFLAWLGLPGTSSFVGEFLITYGAFSYSIPITLLLLVGIVLGGLYPLWMLAHTLWGTPQSPEKLAPLALREKVLLMSLIACTLGIGIYPNFLIQAFKNPAQKIIMEAK